MQVQTTSLKNTQPLDRAIQWLALALVAAVVGFAVYYYVDRQVQPGPTAIDREITEAEQGVRDNPADLGARIDLGNLYLDRGRYDDAVDQFQTVLQASDKAWPAHRGLGLVAYQQARYDVAEQELQKVVDGLKDGEFAGVDKSLEEAYYFLGRSQVNAHEPDAATTNLEAAVQLDRTDADAWELLGATHLAAGRAAEASQAFERAVRLTPKSREAYQMLASAYGVQANDDGVRYAQAMVLYASGDNERAIAALRELTQARPEYSAAWTGLGLAYESAIDKPEAAAAYRQALAGAPSDYNAQAGLARLGASQP
jgi:tetratricopeptide (TPR) repeat protein